MREIGRRDFLKAAAAAGALFAARPGLALGAGDRRPGALRASRLQPDAGLFVVHTDLHNHSLISGDAFGDPDTAYDQMRSRGIDVACLTEHAISGKGHGELTCPGHEYGGCQTIEGINETDWGDMRVLADAAYRPEEFVSFRGFEWSTPSIGHLNVWFSEQFTDALHEHAFFTPRAIAEVDRVAPVPSEVVDPFADAPELATMRFFYEWLSSPPSRAVFGGGNDGIACFNHPNEFGNFEGFRFEPSVAGNIVSCEALNADRDFFWFRRDDRDPNPLVACLNAGWRVGFTGVSDEHSTEYARAGMARGGLWVGSLTRAAVREALIARRSFATFEPGLRLDATANGMPMGAAFAFEEGPVAIDLDIAAAAEQAGRPLVVEVIRPGEREPVLAWAETITMPAPDDPPLHLVITADRSDGDWMFLRITDPTTPAHPRAYEPFASHGGALAYTSPWFFTT